MRCDVCNANVFAGEGTKIPAGQFRKLMDKGFGIDPANINMLTESGMPRQQAIDLLKQQYAKSSSDWLLCPLCSRTATKLLSQTSALNQSEAKAEIQPEGKPGKTADEDVAGSGVSEQSGQQIDEERYKIIKPKLEEIVMEAIKKHGDKISNSDLINHIRESLEKDNPGIYDREWQHIIRFLKQDYKQVVVTIKQKISPTYEAIPKDITVAEKMRALHWAGIPEHLMKVGGQRIGQEFDPNAYFTVLTHLSMKDGYTLDYFYQIDNLGGEPCLYARLAGDHPFKSFSEYWNWKETNALISFLVADGTPDSFFELAVFLRLAGQFYLYWHACYNDIQIITSAADMERVITDVNGQDYSKLDISQITAARSLETKPNVEMTYDSATVTFCYFTKWGGFMRVKERFNRQFPHILLGSEVIDVVEYDCGICF